MTKCLLCHTADCELFVTLNDRHYFRCHNCQARFLHPASHPSRQTEYAHYLHHDNRIDDPAYRQFLARLAAPLMQKLKGNLSGLDYGCGPGPALVLILQEAGHCMAKYDPYFFPDKTPLKNQYDFLTCSETAEHFHDPAKEFARLNQLLKPEGWMGIMTCFQNNDSTFTNWHYRRDPTHVIFYRKSTFQWLADHYCWHIEFPEKDVVLIQKQ